jgi:UDP-N-acetylglucosamine acyltransferase
MEVKIHPTAIVHAGAELDSGVEVGPFTIIGPNVKVGKGSKIQAHVVLDGYTTLGEENQLFPFCSIGTAPQDLKFKGEASTLVFGDRNRIREFVTIQPGTAHGTMATIIGSDNLFMANSHVGHDCRIGSRNVIANTVALAGHVELGDGAILGGMAGIHQFTRVGSMSLIGAGAMVSLDVPPYCIAQGDRASLRGLNLIGMKRAGFTMEDISSIKKLYKGIFLKRGGMRKNIEELPEDVLSNAKAKTIVEFVLSTSRGITLPSKVGDEGEISSDS